MEGRDLGVIRIQGCARSLLVDLPELDFVRRLWQVAGLYMSWRRHEGPGTAVAALCV